MGNHNSMLLYGIIIIVIICLSYFIMRNYFSKYDLKGNLSELNKRLWLILLICSITAVLFTVQISYTEYIDGSSINTNNIIIYKDIVSYSTASYSLWSISCFFVQLENMNYIARAIVLVVLIATLAGIVLSFKYKKIVPLLTCTVLGVISNFFIIIDFQYSTNILGVSNTINFTGVFGLIGVIITSFLIIRNNKKIRLENTTSTI